MTCGSCRFLFHQFIQRDKAHEIIKDADALATLSAALVRSPDINRLDQIMGCICGQFVQIRILMNLLDKQFQILILLFLYFDLLPQCLNVHFQGRLLFCTCKMKVDTEKCLLSFLLQNKNHGRGEKNGEKRYTASATQQRGKAPNRKTVFGKVASETQ